MTDAQVPAKAFRGRHKPDQVSKTHKSEEVLDCSCRPLSAPQRRSWRDSESPPHYIRQPHSMPCSDLQACNSFSTGWGLTWMQQQSLGRPCWRVAAAQSIRRSIRARYSARVSAPPDSAVPAAIEAVRLKLGYISHVFTGHTAARLQGVHVPDRYLGHCFSMLMRIAVALIK